MEEESTNSQQQKNATGNNLEDRPKMHHLERKIKIVDVPMEICAESFDLKQDLISTGYFITWLQLL